MLPKVLADYLALIERAILQGSNVYIECYEEEILTPQRVNLKIRLRFRQAYLLEMHEAIVVTNNQLEFLDYRYHFQDENNCLIFRYDSTPHFPDLPTFPHHKHLRDTVIAAKKPEILQVLQEATTILG